MANRRKDDITVQGATISGDVSVGGDITGDVTVNGRKVGEANISGAVRQVSPDEIRAQVRDRITQAQAARRGFHHVGDLNLSVRSSGESVVGPVIDGDDPSTFPDAFDPN